MSGRRLWPWIALVASAAMVALTLASVLPLLRAALGLALVLLLPGASIATSIDPERRLDGAARAALSLAASIAVTIVWGIALSLSPAGLTTSSWGVGLGSISIALAALAVVRARRASDVPNRGIERGATAAILQAVLVVALASVVSLALVSAASTLPLGSEQAVESGGATRIQLWALAREDSPSRALEVGVDAPRGVIVDCTLRFTQGTTVIGEERVWLAPGQGYRTIVRPSAAQSVMFPIEVVLLSEPSGTELRRVRVWPQPVAPTGVARTSTGG